MPKESVSFLFCLNQLRSAVAGDGSATHLGDTWRDRLRPAIWPSKANHAAAWGDLVVSGGPGRAHLPTDGSRLAIAP
jgi:hypothetical protein